MCTCTMYVMYVCMYVWYNIVKFVGLVMDCNCWYFSSFQINDGKRCNRMDIFKFVQTVKIKGVTGSSFSFLLLLHVCISIFLQI